MSLWQIERTQSREELLDSTGPSAPRVTQIIADGEVLANAAEHTLWSSDPVQIELCSCGVQGCGADGWVSLRRSRGRLMFLPVFDPPGDAMDFMPPHSFARRGAPTFEPPAAEALIRSLGIHRASVPTLTRWDVARLLQWSAPGHVLSDWPAAPQLRRDAVLAATSGDLDDLLNHFDTLLAQAEAAPIATVLREPRANVEAIGFYLDLPGHPEWRVLTRHGDRLDLFLSPFQLS